jgi:outer membrane receptor protein involved in Fe transport
MIHVAFHFIVNATGLHSWLYIPAIAAKINQENFPVTGTGEYRMFLQQKIPCLPQLPVRRIYAILLSRCKFIRLFQLNKMKKIILLVILFSASKLFAQQPPGMQGGPGSMASNSGHVFGKISDSTGKALSGISVMLMKREPGPTASKPKDVLLKGVITKNNGEFNFEDLPTRNNLTLKISGVGYKPSEHTIKFEPGKNDRDLGTISLTITASELSGVVVTATKSLMKLDIDKKVFNVDKNIVSEGGTAVDVMKNVPSLQVDIDGNVTLRNSAPQIFVDGLPTTLTLEQIPANAIESVEVITNPSAKYDASGGGAGILNIILKKNKKMGYNGNLRAGVNKYGGVDGGVDFSVRENKINLSMGVNVRQATGKSTGLIDRVNLSDLPVTTVNQDSRDRNKGTMIFGRVGLDYFLTNKTTISVGAMRMHGAMSPHSFMQATTDSLFDTGTTSFFSDRNTYSSRIFNGQGLTAGLKHIYSDKEDLTVNVNYFTGKGENNTLYTTNYFAGDKYSEIVNTTNQKIIGGGTDKNLIIQADYTKQFVKGPKLEAGARAAIRSRINLNDNYIYDNASQDYILLPSTASNYKSSDNVYAAYATISSNIKSFGYKVGLRAESSSYNGELTDTKEKFSNKYPVSFLPSIFLSQKLGGNQELQLSVTRRINRPNFFQLIPFVDSTDKLNIRKGNPSLVPEFTQSFEANYLKTFHGNNTFLASVYYKKTNHLITNYLEQQTDANGNSKLINTFINANSAYAAGSEFTLQDNWTKWWSTSADLNIYNSKVNTNSSASTDALWSWFGKINNNFKLPSNFNVQLSGMYQSKTNLITNNDQGGGPGGPPPGMMSQSSSQGYIKAFYAVDIAVKKGFLNNKLTVSLSMNDIFRSRKQSQYSYSDYFTQSYVRLRDPQMVRLNLAYNFGKIDASLFKRKAQSNEQMSGDL